MLRLYQRSAVDALWQHLRTNESNPAIVIPTGGGKTHVMAEICRAAVQDWGGRILILAHVKELLEQTAGKLQAAMPGAPIGIYSAGLNRRDLGYAVTVAGIQSIYKKADAVGKVDLILVDEAHLIPPDGEGMYRTLLDAIDARVIGLTATPYRMKSGLICGLDNILNEVCYEISVKELINTGYLCKLQTYAGARVANTTDLHTRAGEFVASEVEESMEAIVQSACAEVLEATASRKSVLIFCAGVEHCQHVAERIGAEVVTGTTPSAERAAIIERFKSGQTKYLCNVNVLTTGFDATNIDTIVLMRATLSPGLYYQMVGRGFRLHPGKENCLILDYGGNVVRHGPVDAIQVKDKTKGNGDAPVKVCPKCQLIQHAGYQECIGCGFVFPINDKPKHDAQASGNSIISIERRTEQVHKVTYHVHNKINSPLSNPTMRVEYEIAYHEVVREWVCIEHDGFAKRKAIDWWTRRCREPVPTTVEEAVTIANSGAMAETKEITIVKDGKWDRIKDYKLGPKPEDTSGSGHMPSDERLPYNPPSLEVTADNYGDIDFDEVPF